MIECVKDKKLLNKYWEYTFERFVDSHDDNFSWCPKVGCNYVFSFDPGRGQFKCAKCLSQFCLVCKTDWH